VGLQAQQTQQLKDTVALLQKRWGSRAIQKLGQARTAWTHPAISTGFATVDSAIGIGGIPKGRITEFIACGTDGQSALALSTLLQAQRAGDQIIYVDVDHTVDLDYMARCGIRFDSLAILQPLSLPHAFEMTSDLLRDRGTGLVIFDRLNPLRSTDQQQDQLDQMLRDWVAELTHSLCALLFLSKVVPLDAYPQGLALPFFASLRLSFERQDWLYDRGQITGFCSRVTILKNKLGTSGQSIPIEIQLPKRSCKGQDG